MNENRIEHYDKILPEVAKQCSDRERLAEETEREVVKMKKAEYMRMHIGEEYEGVISGVTKWGIYVDFLIQWKVLSMSWICGTIIIIL